MYKSFGLNKIMIPYFVSVRTSQQAFVCVLSSDVDWF